MTGEKESRIGTSLIQRGTSFCFPFELALNSGAAIVDTIIKATFCKFECWVRGRHRTETGCRRAAIGNRLISMFPVAVDSGNTTKKSMCATQLDKVP